MYDIYSVMIYIILYHLQSKFKCIVSLIRLAQVYQNCIYLAIKNKGFTFLNDPTNIYVNQSLI